MSQNNIFATIAIILYCSTDSLKKIGFSEKKARGRAQKIFLSHLGLLFRNSRLGKNAIASMESQL
ncbi:regulatory protein TetR [Arthrospira platensis C1]|nr:regulatory protein TetR [Arthrospira platensis C1]